MDDYLTASGATKLAAKIQKFWAEKGVAVKAWIEVINPNDKDASKIYGVRSNLNAAYPSRTPS